jgi:hypothetical protein
MLPLIFLSPLYLLLAYLGRMCALETMESSRLGMLQGFDRRDLIEEILDFGNNRTLNLPLMDILNTDV